MDIETNEGAAAPADDLSSVIDAAMAAQTEPVVEQQEPEAAVEETDEARAARARDEKGRFAPKAGEEPEPAAAPVVEQPAAAAPASEASAYRPPPGFSVASKTAWDQLPESVRADIAKREEEVDAGFKRYTGLGRFAEEAERNGTTLQAAVADYHQVETGLRQNFLAGVEGICQRFGVDPRALASAMQARYGGQGEAQQGQPQERQPPQIDPRAIAQQAANEVRAELEAQRLKSEVEAFEANPKNKFYANVRGDMASLINTGKAKTLEQAYEAACWLNPEIRALLIKEQSSVQASKPNAAVQARAAAKAVGGAPAPGINTGQAKPKNLSIADSVDAAVNAQLGAA